MKKLLLILLAINSWNSFAGGFNYSAYQSSSLVEIKAKWNDITKGYEPGFSAKQPEKVSVSAIAVGGPFKCNTQPLVWIFNSLKMSQLLQQAPINYCIKLKMADDEPEFYAYIQDVLTPAYAAEVKPGASVKLFSVFIAFAVTKSPNTNFPLFLVSEFQVLSQEIHSKSPIE